MFHGANKTENPCYSGCVLLWKGQHLHRAVSSSASHWLTCTFCCSHWPQTVQWSVIICINNKKNWNQRQEEDKMSRRKRLELKIKYLLALDSIEYITSAIGFSCVLSGRLLLHLVPGNISSIDFAPLSPKWCSSSIPTSEKSSDSSDTLLSLRSKIVKLEIWNSSVLAGVSFPSEIRCPLLQAEIHSQHVYMWDVLLLNADSYTSSYISNCRCAQPFHNVTTALLNGVERLRFISTLTY